MATFCGVVYVAFVFDVFSRMILGWRAATSMKTDLVLDTLEMAMFTRARQGVSDLSGLVHHNDAGSQGGFQRSSQHLDVGGVAWRHGSRRRLRGRRRSWPVGVGNGRRIERCDRRCVRPGGPSLRARSSVRSGG